MRTKLSLGIVASLLLASTAASAANLVNKGGSSDVPTYQGTNRRYLIKAAGTSCPSNFTCFCDSGAQCVLPWTLVTGTVVVDRPGVTLDCQNRMIQPPRYAGSKQECTDSSQCGQHSSGSPKHACVSGYCQLGGLGGINVGGPYGVDDGSSININVDATGFAQDVNIRNCKVRNHYAGVVVQGSGGDDGPDLQEVWSSELRTGHIGLSMTSTDNSSVFGIHAHDNAETGMDLEYNWSLQVLTNHVRANGLRQIYFHGSRERPNRWLTIGANIVTSTFRPSNSAPWPIGNVLVYDMQGTLAGQCESEGALCDVSIESNIITANNDQASFEFRRSYNNGATTLLRNNEMTQYWPFVDVLINRSYPETFHMPSRCWDKDNVCHREDGGPVNCVTNLPNEFTNSWCWY